MRTFSILLILLSLNTLTACGESKQDKIANLERKIKVAQKGHDNCVFEEMKALQKGQKLNEQGTVSDECVKIKQEYYDLQSEYEKLVKS